MEDKTEAARRALLEAGVAPAAEEKIWTTDELQLEFDVVGFLAPFVEVVRKVDGVRGTMMFRHSPRVYFGFEAA